MSSSVDIVLNFVGNTSIFNNIKQELNIIQNKTDNMSSSIKKLFDIGMGLNGVFETIKTIKGVFDEFAEANRAQVEAEQKLAQVMHNTMGASAAEVQSIKDLAAAQQQLGVIGDEVQLAGAQELGTYLQKADSLRKLMPVMNDMLAQQYGLNASQEQAVQIASMMGKVMDGQVGALSRYGYKFDEAQEKILKYGTEAQKVSTLAEVISQSVGGMNAALAATPEGQLQQAANRLGDIKEQIGAIWIRLQTALLPAMNRIMGLIEAIVAAVQAGWPVWVATAAGIVIAITLVKKKLDSMCTSLVVAGASAVGTGFSFQAMAAVARTACRSISTAIKSIPIVGWIAAAIALVIEIFQTLWNKCEAFRGFLTGVWEVIKNTFNNLVEIVRPIIQWIVATIRSRIQAFVERIKSIIGWVRGVFSKVGSWFKGVMQPVWDWFGNLWENIKSIFGKVVEFMGRIFNPIIALWNKLTNGNVEKFNAGYQKGAAAVRDNKQKKGIAPVAQFAQGEVGSLGTQADSKAAKNAETVATGGTRNTQITINLGKMIETIAFNGSFSESVEGLQQQVEEALLRTLYAAQSAAV